MRKKAYVHGGITNKVKLVDLPRFYVSFLVSLFETKDEGTSNTQDRYVNRRYPYRLVLFSSPGNLAGVPL